MADYEAAPGGGIKEAGTEQPPVEPKKDDAGLEPAARATPEEVATEAAPTAEPETATAPDAEAEEKTEEEASDTDKAAEGEKSPEAEEKTEN
jgi:hypothetical protein